MDMFSKGNPAQMLKLSSVQWTPQTDQVLLPGDPSSFTDGDRGRGREPRGMSLAVPGEEAPGVPGSRPDDSPAPWEPGAGLLPEPPGAIPDFSRLPHEKMLMPTWARKEATYEGGVGEVSLTYASGFRESLPACVIWQNIRQHRESTSSWKLLPVHFLWMGPYTLGAG